MYEKCLVCEKFKNQTWGDEACEICMTSMIAQSITEDEMKLMKEYKLTFSDIVVSRTKNVGVENKKNIIF